MKGRVRAFTLAELLIVLVIIAVIASAMFPVFFTARQAAKAAACSSNFRQVYAATNLYLNDYDDTYMPVNHNPAEEPNSSNDRTWVQLVLPYINSFSIFRCPEDDNDRPRREATFDEDLVPGDTYSQYYTASLRTNVGFNFIYFSPIFQFQDHWAAEPKNTSQVGSPSETYLFIDSVWTLEENGTPTGGGSWLVVPPCRFDEADQDTFLSDPSAVDIFTNKSDGWEVGKQTSPLQYGATWPWHAGGTRMTTVAADGSVRSRTPNQITDGCKVMSGWQGWIQDPQKYQWDLK